MVVVILRRNFVSLKQHHMKQFFTFLFITILSLQAFAQTQTVSGRVYDEASNAPLVGATITVIGNTELGIATDDNGNFRLAGVSLGRQSFKIKYLGYEDRVVSDIVITAGKEVNLN